MHLTQFLLSSFSSKSIWQDFWWNWMPPIEWIWFGWNRDRRDRFAGNEEFISELASVGYCRVTISQVPRRLDEKGKCPKFDSFPCHLNSDRCRRDWIGRFRRRIRTDLVLSTQLEGTPLNGRLTGATTNKKFNSIKDVNFCNATFDLLYPAVIEGFHFDFLKCYSIGALSTADLLKQMAIIS